MEIKIENSSKLLDQYQSLLIKTINDFPVFEKEEAMDEAREVLIDAIETYDAKKAGFGGYLKYRLYYHFLDKSKKPRPKSLNDLDHTGCEIVESLEANIDIEKDLLDKENLDELYKALKNLETKEKMIIYMEYYQKMGQEEIANSLNLSPKTIRNTKYKAIEKLRKSLNQVA